MNFLPKNGAALLSMTYIIIFHIFHFNWEAKTTVKRRWALAQKKMKFLQEMLGDVCNRL